MRISDWSSDVCSSDLDGLGGELVVHSSLKGKGVVRHIGCAAARINRSGSTAADVAGDIGVERQQRVGRRGIDLGRPIAIVGGAAEDDPVAAREHVYAPDRKSTRLNSSH